MSINKKQITIPVCQINSAHSVYIFLNGLWNCNIHHFLIFSVEFLDGSHGTRILAVVITRTFLVSIHCVIPTTPLEKFSNDTLGSFLKFLLSVIGHPLTRFERMAAVALMPFSAKFVNRSTELKKLSKYKDTSFFLFSGMHSISFYTTLIPSGWVDWSFRSFPE